MKVTNLMVAKVSTGILAVIAAFLIWVLVFVPTPRQAALLRAKRGETRGHAKYRVT